MRKTFSIFALITILAVYDLNAQQPNSLYSRLCANSNNGVDFFNVDGIEITSQTIESPFTREAIVKKFRQYSIRDNDLVNSDSAIPPRNYYVSKSESARQGSTEYSSYYFVENKSNDITAITFASYKSPDREFERKFIGLLLNHQIPAFVYASHQMDSVEFAGRKFALGGRCQWMGVNNLQCPGFGQMNWSIHQSQEDALASVTNQCKLIRDKKGGKIISEDSVDVVFEGSLVKAKKAVYDFKGVKSLLVGMSGGKTLTIYFVAAPVRNNYVSCVMSFWNNDSIDSSGLAPLLSQVMSLKK